MNKEIKFYNTDKAYGCFSNFYVAPFEVDGLTWRTTEHYFQAMKFIGTEHYELINKVEKPMEAARMGRDRIRPLRKDWEQVKDRIMYNALKAKFDKHYELRQVLLSTGDAILIEHTKNDIYWADAGDGSGKNVLGELLMKLRSSYDEYDGKFYLPQWIEFPNIHPLDMFWRMGVGEDYVMHVYEWTKKWGEIATREYERYFPYPEEWEKYKS